VYFSYIEYAIPIRLYRRTCSYLRPHLQFYLVDRLHRRSSSVAWGAKPPEFSISLAPPPYFGDSLRKGWFLKNGCSLPTGDFLTLPMTFSHSPSFSSAHFSSKFLHILNRLPTLLINRLFYHIAPVLQNCASSSSRMSSLFPSSKPSMTTISLPKAVNLQFQDSLFSNIGTKWQVVVRRGLFTGKLRAPLDVCGLSKVSVPVFDVRS